MKPYFQTPDSRVVLYHADCRDVMKTMDNGAVDCVITDPPYNVGKDYGGHNDSMSEDQYAEWCREIVSGCQLMCSNQFWVAPRYKLALWTTLMPSAHLIVIRRGAAGPLRGGYSDQFEIALATGKPSRVMPDLWSDIRLKGEGYFFREETFGHPGYTPYPIMRRAVELFATDKVFDPFTGTGTTAAACIELGRAFVGSEISEQYCDIAVERIQTALEKAKQMDLAL